MAKNTKLLIHISEKDKARLKVAAEKLGQNLSALTRLYINEGLDRFEKQYGEIVIEKKEGQDSEE